MTTSFDVKKKFDEIICGDAFETLVNFQDGCFDLVLTSPPYWKQRNYSIKGIGDEETLEEYLDNLLRVFVECLRVTKDTGSIVFNLGDKYINKGLQLVPYRFAIKALEHARLVNCITWVKKNPLPRKETKKLIQSTEPFFIFVKGDNYKFNLQNYMVDKKPYKAKGSLKCGLSYFEKIEKSDLTKDQKRRAKKTLEEAIEEVRTGKIMNFRLYLRDAGWNCISEVRRKKELREDGFFVVKISGKNVLKKDVIECAAGSRSVSKHPAVFPEKIISEIIKLLTDEGDIILDPFVGSGTTAVAAKKLKRHFVGIDINPKYCCVARDKIVL